MAVERVLILGAAGRDFHCFNTYFRDNPHYEVIAFTAAQIPGIADRRYPPALSGPRYADGIPIHPEDQLETLIRSCTIEEREEYEQHIRAGVVVYAGVDYERILRAAEQEADVILWDGGNNDWPFFRPNLEIVLLDPHRAGHELLYRVNALKVQE